MTVATDPRLPIATARAAAVQAAAQADLDTILDDLGRWVDQDSPSGDAEALDACARDVAATLARHGWPAELVAGPAGLAVHARLRGPGRARVALVCHHDTVFPRGTAASRPFSRRDGVVLGPGVADMKGGLAVALHAGRLLAAAGLEVGVLELVSVPDEELRTAPFPTLDRLAGFDAALVTECGRPGNGIVTARKAGRWLELHALGRGAHAGTEPDEGRNAVLALCSEALRIAALHRPGADTTVQVTRLHGGDVVNTVPPEATLSLDVRAMGVADREAVVEEIRRVGRHDGVALRLETTESTPPLERTPASAALAGAALTLGDALGAPVHEVVTGGVSDGCWTAAAGIPTLDGLGPVGALDHTEDEYAEVASFPLRCGLLAGLVTAVEEGLS